MMARRLHMTTADYVAIAISPALIMALVGSLVFFLIEVLYVGQYQARLNYVFALFVFAGVLVGRISIEMGSERAALFALPLGAATFLVLLRFVEHPSPLSPLINLLLIAVVWWCAHKLTWDCTLIDDNQDASGEGLLQRIGVDTNENDHSVAAGRGSAGNELVDERDEPLPWWRRWAAPKSGPHSPGLWVLYFSLAALPLFGIGQGWIPPADVSRRQYAFSLLLVYVASGLALLVTTSFLGLRRYLRQRNVEMPAPMAATWVAIGVVLIVLVMFVAALVPRPHAEYAISQVPWEVRSPDGLRASRQGFGREATDQQDESGQVGSDDEDAPVGSATDDQSHEEAASSDDGERTGDESSGNRQSSNSANDSNSTSDQPRDPAKNQAENQTENQTGDSSSDRSSRESGNETGSARSGEQGDQNNTDTARDESSQQQEPSTEGDTNRQDETRDEGGGRSGMRLPDHENQFNPAETLQQLPAALGGLLKLLFYVVAGLAVLYLAWKHRRELLKALFDIIRQVREILARLLGGTSRTGTDGEADAPQTALARRRFRDFRDPFLTGKHEHIAPAELVCYTFEAFEAWAGDRGHPRTPDQTPHELLRSAVDPQSPIYTEARHMVRLYSELAYASGTVTRESANGLRQVWQLMRTAEPLVGAAP